VSGQQPENVTLEFSRVITEGDRSIQRQCKLTLPYEMLEPDATESVYAMLARVINRDEIEGKLL
jgi:hypothetical protein